MDIFNRMEAEILGDTHNQITCMSTSHKGFNSFS